MAEAYQCDGCDNYDTGEPAGRIKLLNDVRRGGYPVLDFCGDCIDQMKDEYDWEVSSENIPVDDTFGEGGSKGQREFY